jgi:hypothetical protein
MRIFIWFVTFLLAAHGTAWAQQQKGIPGKEISGRGVTPVDAPLPPSPYEGKPLPELKGVVSWKTLAQVEPIKQKDRFVPQFSNNITMLDKKEVRLQGFMMPLDMGETQKRFILTSMPPSCAFCLPGGPDQLVEVQAKTAVKYGFEPIILTGRFQVLRDDPMGLYYRLVDAVAISK